MTTLLGTIFYTDEKIVAQADVKFLGLTVESLVVEFDQDRFEEFLSSGSKSPKAMRKYRKVSSGTRSQVSSETSPKVTCVNAHNVSSAASSKILKASFIAHTIHVNVSQETHRANVLAHGQKDGEDQSHHHSPL